MPLAVQVLGLLEDTASPVVVFSAFSHIVDYLCRIGQVIIFDHVDCSLFMYACCSDLHLAVNCQQANNVKKISCHAADDLTCAEFYGLKQLIKSLSTLNI